MLNREAILSYKQQIIDNQDRLKDKLNAILTGQDLESIRAILQRIDHSGHLPHWFSPLKENGSLPNLDGKTVGSVIEKLVVCALENFILQPNIHLSVNPAKGVDVPELELGIKSPSTNFCTSEPYFSAYERLLGNENDALVLLTNYQEAKRHTPFNLQILDICYLNGSEIADKNLCRIARGLRSRYGCDEVLLKKMMRFLAYVNQSDWEAKWIVRLFERVLINNENLEEQLNIVHRDFQQTNARNERGSNALIPDDCLTRILAIRNFTPMVNGIADAGDNWVITNEKDNGRYPNDNEWNRMLRSPLNGRIGMSFALQWRYNFGSLFRTEHEQE